MVNRSAFREDIEALRGFAILLVVFFHAQVPCFAAGFVGVDIFFTISGFVITRSLISENQKTGSIDLWGFYSRRIGRLLPASLLLAASVVIASLFISSSPEFVLDAKDAIVAVLYGLNIQQALTADDYFQEREEDRQTPLLHFWSLNVEEQFYILWPLLMKLCCQFRGRQIFLVLAACGLMGGSFVFNIYYTENNQPFAFYLPVSRAWQFGAGGLCAWLQEKPLSGTWKVLTQAIFYLGLVVSLLFLNSERTWPGYWALIPTVFTMAYIAGFEEGPEAFHPHAERPTESAYSAELVGSQGRLGFLRGPFDTVASGVWKSMLFLGQLSYSWYLWHWPFQIFFLRLFPDASVAAQAWAGTFALAPAWLSFVFLEAPLRAAAKKSTNSMSIIFKGAVAMLVFVVASWFLIISHSLTPASSPTTVGTVQWQQQQQQQQQQEDQQQKAPQFGKADGLSSVSEGGEIEELTLPPQRQAPLNLYAPEKNQSPSVHGTNEDGSVGTVGGQRDWGDDFIFKNSTFGELKVDLWLKMLRPSLGECPEARPEEAVPKNPLPAKLKRTGMCSLYGNGTQIVSTGPRYDVFPDLSQGKLSIFAYGDSHLSTILPALVSFTESRGIPLHFRFALGCPLAVIHWKKRYKAQNYMWYGCNDTSSAFMDYMTDPPWESHTQQAGGSTDNSVVLVINFFYGAESLKIKPLHSTKNDPWLEGAEALEAFDAGYAAALSRLLKAGRRALFVLANPMKAGEPLFKFNRCIAEKRHPSDCDFHWSKPVLPKVEELVREHPNQLGLFDFSDYACEPPERPPNPSRLCKAVVDHRGVLVDNHFNKDTVLSNRFQQFFAKKLEEELGKLNF